MEFVLVYDGPLPAYRSEARASVKQGIREVFHPQLEELWKLRGDLFDYSRDGFPEAVIQTDKTVAPVDPKDRRLWRGGFWQAKLAGFVLIPLVTRWNGLHCTVDITLLRRRPKALGNFADLDNRVKTLIDGLRMPLEVKELGDQRDVAQGQFFCLLENDSLIGSYAVHSHDLMGAPADAASQDNVKAFIRITVSSWLD